MWKQTRFVFLAVALSAGLPEGAAYAAEVQGRPIGAAPIKWAQLIYPDICLPSTIPLLP
jgi:hypothetical protein